jgi:hypothetical protein
MMKFLKLSAVAFLLFGCSSEPIDEPLIDPGVIDNTDTTIEPGLSDLVFNHPSFDVTNPIPWLEWQDDLRETLKDESVDTEDFIGML